MPSDTMTSLCTVLAQEHPQFYHFLESHRVGKGKAHTMTGMDPYKGNWSIADDEYPRFLDLFHEWHFVKGKRALPLVEQPRPNQSKPLLIDLDFHYKFEDKLNRRFTDAMIRNFCKRIADAWDHFFDLKDSYKTLCFFVMLRPQPYNVKKEKIKDGIHIVCPDLTVTNDNWNVVRKYLLEKNAVSDVFASTGYTNSPHDILDKTMGGQQGWMFYGASKMDVAAYQLKNVLLYDTTTKEWEEEEGSNYDERELLNVLSVRYQIDDEKIQVREGLHETYEQYLNPTPVQADQSQQIVQTAAGLTAASDPAVATLTSLYATHDDSGIIRKLVMECLSEDRAENHDSWMRVGWCLHNIAKTEEMFDLWIDFSKQKCPSKWLDHRSREQYNLKRDWNTGMRMVGDGLRLTEKSLYKWARDDNLEVYTRILKENISAYISTTTDATHYHIALLLQKMYGSTYIASVSPRDTDWYHYDDALNMWRQLNQGMELRQKICTEVADQIQHACSYAGGKTFTTNDPVMKKFYAEKQQCLLAMQIKLYNYSFGSSVMSMCSQIFCEPDFEQKLNTNPFLFCCSNGILELRHKNAQEPREHVIFRQGRPEDYMSFLAGRNYPETDAIAYIPYKEFVAAKDPRIAEMDDFFCKLFPRPDLKKHVLKLLASCLEGANREQLYYFFIGVGSNGKSKMITLMKLVFGDYQTALQATVLTRKRPESGAANPDIMAIKNRRFIYSQEPDDKEPLNTSRMKQLSGEDMVEARAMYKDQEKFKVMGKMFMMCNRLPPIHAMDNGTWRRIRVIPFESRFEEVDHPDVVAKKPGFFPRDNSLDAKLMAWREPFLSYLVHIYETEYIPNGMQPEPAVVKQESERYKADHDAFARFRMERVRERRDGFEEVTDMKYSLKDIMKAFNRWAVAAGTRKLDAKEIEMRCEEAFGDSRGKKEYSHIRVFLEDEEVEQFERDHNDLQGAPEANLIT